MTQEILDLVYRLKDSLSKEARIVKLEQLEEEMNNSLEVARLASKKEIAVDDVNFALNHFKDDSEEVKNAKRKLSEAKKELDTHPLVKAYMEQYKVVRNYYNEINDILFSIINNKDKIKAYIITHGHDEQMSALKYFYDAAPAPIYCSKFTKELMEIQCRIQDVKTKTPMVFKVVDPTSDFEIVGHKIHTFQTAHNVPGSFGLAIETDRGNIVYSGDFIVDYSLKEKDYIFDFQAVGRIAEKPTFLLMEESKSASKPGYCAPHHRVREKIIKYFRDEQKRIFIDCFWQNMYRIQEIVSLCKEFNKKIYCYNKYTYRLMQEFVTSADFGIKPEDLVTKEDLLRIRAQDTVILLLAHGDELYSELTRLAFGENDDKRISLNENDIFINCALATPTYQVAETRSMDNIYRTGCSVVWLKNKDVTAMHAHQEDTKALLSFLKPKYYFPVRGTFVDMMSNAKLALNMGIGLTHMNIFILDNGMQVVFDGDRRPQIIPNEAAGIDISPALVDGKGISTVGDDIIDQRKKLAVDGVVVVAASISHKDKKIIAGPDCQMRGFVYVKEAEPLLKSVSQIFVDEINLMFANGGNDIKAVKNAISERAKRFIKRDNGREPLVCPMIIELD